MTENVTNNYDSPVAPDAFEPEADCAVGEDEILVKDCTGKSVKLEVPDDVEDDQA